MSDVRSAAAELTSRLQGEQQELPPAEVAVEAQGELAQEQEAAPIEEEATQETLEASDTEVEPNLHKVKIDGEEVDVEYDELLKGYSRETHYQRNMKALSEKREAIEAKAQKVDAQLADTQALLEGEIANLDSPEMQELKQYDELAYYKAVDKVKAKVDKFERVKAARMEEHSKQMEKLQAKQKQALIDQFPEWSDQAEFDKGINNFNKVLESVGISESELAQTAGVDHRMYLIANEIQKGRDAIKALSDIKNASLDANKVKSKPKTAKPGTTTTANDRASADLKAMREKFKRSGSIHDAANLLRM